MFNGVRKNFYVSPTARADRHGGKRLLNFSQSIGGTPGVDDRIRISNGGKADGARLVGWASIQSDGIVSCRSCDFNDGAGGTGCQNHP
jgi:hypothetical protein